MVANYLHEFECLLTRIFGMSHHFLLIFFLSELRNDIQQELYLLKSQLLCDEMGMAKLIDDKCNTTGSSSVVHPVTFTKPPPPPPGPPPMNNHLGSLPIKHLTLAEMAARRDKGLCFNCDSKFVLGHRCNPPQFLCLMVDTEEESFSMLRILLLNKT